MKPVTLALLPLLLAACTHHHQIPASSNVAPFTRIDRGKGALEGAGLGALVGGAAGVLGGFADGDDECTGEWDFCFSASDKAIVFGVAGAVGGALVGGVIGIARGSRDVYERPGGMAVTIAPRAGGAAALATWRF